MKLGVCDEEGEVKREAAWRQGVVSLLGFIGATTASVNLLPGKVRPLVLQEAGEE